ncbi:MADS-box protein defh21-like [Humulus lupulus]|uniref:MADS-box protein defh21-like n=1 Tax=Humulus lupulus TaxID=3486 RepID=UPI002B4028D4|nr:MADS-box protein defh21-like [Humulus lupulus]
MGRRGKLPLKLKPKERARRITFAKRRSGLIKKAYELSTLCDVKVCLIVNDYTNQPSEPVATWPKNPREVRALINDYITAMTLKPASKRLLTMADFLNDRIQKVNAETEKVSHTQTMTTTTTKSKSSYQEKLVLGESYIAELSGTGTGNQLSEFVSDLDNKIEQVNERMKHLIHVYHYNHFGMQEPLNGSSSGSSSSTSTYDVQPSFAQYYSPHDPHQAMAAATQMYQQQQLQFPYYNDNKPQPLLQQQQLPWIHDQPSSSSSKALVPFNPSSQTVSFDDHYNNGSFTWLLTSDDYAADQYYSSSSTNGTTTALLEGQGDMNIMFNNNIPLMLESGEALHQNDQNGMMLSNNPMVLPYVNQSLCGNNILFNNNLFLS